MTYPHYLVNLEIALEEANKVSHSRIVVSFVRLLERHFQFNQIMQYSGLPTVLMGTLISCFSFFLSLAQEDQGIRGGSRLCFDHFPHFFQNRRSRDIFSTQQHEYAYDAATVLLGGVGG